MAVLNDKATILAYEFHPLFITLSISKLVHDFLYFTLWLCILWFYIAVNKNGLFYDTNWTVSPDIFVLSTQLR